MVMSIKMTQKRGRRTDSITLDMDALSKEKTSVIEVRTKLFNGNGEITMIIGDLTITVLMDNMKMAELADAISTFAPFLIQLGEKRGAPTGAADLSSSLYKLLQQPRVVVEEPKKEGCTPCEERAREDLANYFENILNAFDKGETVSEEIKKHITMIRDFPVDLRLGGKRAKEAFKQAMDFLSHYP